MYCLTTSTQHSDSDLQKVWFLNGFANKWEKRKVKRKRKEIEKHKVNWCKMRKEREDKRKEQ